MIRKPGSVVDSHLSSTYITVCLKRSLPGGQRAASTLPIRSCSRRGLPGTSVTCRPVGSYPTLSPLPGAETGRSSLCCTFLWLAPTGRYPASCPVEPGLSSPAFAAATIRTTPKKVYHRLAHSSSRFFRAMNFFTIYGPHLAPKTHGDFMAAI